MNEPTESDRFDEAVAAHQSGDLARAERLYRQLLEEDEDDAMVLELLGALLVARGCTREAQTHLEKSIGLDPNSPTAHLAHADVLTASGDLSAAERSLEAAERLLAAMDPKIAASIDAEVLSTFAIRDRFEDAAAWWERRRDSNANSDASAAVAISGVRAVDPGRADRLQAAIAQRRFGPAAADVIAGMAAFIAGDHRTAADRLGRAVALRPDDVSLIATCASTFNETGRAAEAAAMLEVARSRHPDQVPLLVESARSSLLLHNYHEAERLFREAHSLDPAAVAPMRGLVELTLLSGRYGDCVDWCDRIRENDHDEISEVCASEALAGSLRQSEGLARLEAAPAQARQIVRQSLYLANFLDSLPESEIYRRHAAFGASISNADPARSESERRDALRRVLGQRRPIRIGFLSPDFRRHSVSYFVEPLLAWLDRGRFETIGISDTMLVDSVTDRIRACCDGWIDVAGSGFQSFRDQVSSLELDILVELAGHTSCSRLPELAHRIAPVQMSWLGYPNTTGVGSIDFRLVDAWTDPPGSDALATETLIRMPRCFLCHLRPPDAPEPGTPVRHGGPVFGSFNNLAKITDTTIRLWSDVLQAEADSTLLIKSKAFRDAATLERLRERFRSMGVQPDRIHVRPWSGGTNEHLLNYREIHVALDTFPYQGTTTTCEALSMGVPVISLAGDGHRSRVGSSLLNSIGRSYWSVRDNSAFVAAAIAAASQREEPRHDLLEGTALRDPKGFAQDFADALDAAAIARDASTIRDG